MVHKKDNYGKDNTGSGKGDAGTGDNKSINLQTNFSEFARKGIKKSIPNKPFYKFPPLINPGYNFRNQEASKMLQVVYDECKHNSRFMEEMVELTQDNVDIIIDHIIKCKLTDEASYLRDDFKQWLQDNFVFSEEDDPYNIAIENLSKEFFENSGNCIASEIEKAIENENFKLRVLIPSHEELQENEGAEYCKIDKEVEENYDGTITTIWWEL